MISIEGHIFTDPQETHDVYEKLCGEWGKNHDQVRKPACDKERGGCGKTTCYMVIDEKDRYSMKFYSLMLAGNAYPSEGMLYMAVQQCHKCSAAQDGYRCGRRHPMTHDQDLKRIRENPLTAEERAEYINIFERGFKKGLNETIRDEAQALNKKNPSKYAFKE